jgi:hypothetical protein
LLDIDSRNMRRNEKERKEERQKEGKKYTILPWVA